MSSQETQNVLHHWREAVPEDRLAHLIKDATRSLIRALQFRLADHNVSFGHWAFLRILWEQDGLTQRELSERAGVMEPTTFAAMKAMESLGYIERRHLPGNKKNLHVYLTRTGKALAATARTRRSSLKAQRSSREPPPRTSSSASTSSRRLARARARSRAAGASAPWTRLG